MCFLFSNIFLLIIKGLLPISEFISFCNKARLHREFLYFSVSIFVSPLFKLLIISIICCHCSSFIEILVLRYSLPIISSILDLKESYISILIKFNSFKISCMKLSRLSSFISGSFCEAICSKDHCLFFSYLNISKGNLFIKKHCDVL